MSMISYKRLDERVMITMFAICTLAVMILAFRYTNDESCIDVEIKFDSVSLYVNSKIRFTAEPKSGSYKNHEWRFGDGTQSNEISPDHIYRKAGLYVVRLKVNNCSYAEKAIAIYNSSENDTSKTKSKPQFTGPETAFIGEPVTFKDSTPNATSWKWNFGEDRFKFDITQQPTYTFQTQGIKIITLQINDNINGTMKINVIPKPIDKSLKEKLLRVHIKKLRISEKPETATLNDQLNIEPPVPEEEKPRLKAPDISSEQMKELLKQIIDGRKDIQVCSDYFCGNLTNPIITYNNRIISFSMLCSEIKDYLKKAKNIKEMEIVISSDENNCIKSMKVSVKRKGIIGRTFD